MQKTIYKNIILQKYDGIQCQCANLDDVMNTSN